MGRAPCCDKANVKKGPWSPEEDAKLKSYIEKHGTGGNWIALPQKIGLKRCGKSCRLRWLNYLRPNIKHGGFSEEEDKIILSLYVSIGSRWSIIAAQLPGRTDNDIKNYWNTRLKKKLLGKQRRDQQHTRKANNMIKQEDNITKVDPISFTSSMLFNNNNNQIPYWSPQFVTLPSSISSIPNYSNSSESFNDHSSIRKLLMNVGGHYYDHNNNITYPNNVINQATNNNNLSNIHSSEMITTTFHDDLEGQIVEVGMVERQSNKFPQELEELMSSNTQMMVSDGLEYLYGDCGNYLVKNNQGSTSDITTCGDSTSLGWGDQMSSLVYLPKLESNHNIQYAINPMSSSSCLDGILSSGIREGSLEEN